MKKYLVCPGYITSKTDGDRHFIGSNDLVRLYGVDPKECAFEIYGEHAGRGRRLIQLHPDSTGRYEVPA